jgi:hypothetical protein
MNRVFLRFLLLTAVASCVACGPADRYKPESSLSPARQEQFLYSIARYTAKLPKRVTHQDKFDARYDGYFRQEMKSYKVEGYYAGPDSTHFFLISRPAPSLREKRVAIGGRLRYDAKGNLVRYEEVFRTWKMEKEELTRKSSILFDTMIKTGNVNSYLPHKTEEDWVEFPDERNYFDLADRRWKIKGQPE